MSLSRGIAGNNQTLSLLFQPGPCCVPQMDTEQSPLKFTLENPRPHPHVTGLGRGALEEVVRSEGRAPMNGIKYCCCSVMSDSLGPHGLSPLRLLCPWGSPGKNAGLSPLRLLCPWGSPGKNAGVVCHFLLQGIFQTPRIKLASPSIGRHGQADSLPP